MCWHWQWNVSTYTQEKAIMLPPATCWVSSSVPLVLGLQLQTLDTLDTSVGVSVWTVFVYNYAWLPPAAYQSPPSISRPRAVMTHTHTSYVMGNSGNVHPSQSDIMLEKKDHLFYLNIHLECFYISTKVCRGREMWSWHFRDILIIDPHFQNMLIFNILFRAPSPLHSSGWRHTPHCPAVTKVDIM